MRAFALTTPNDRIDEILDAPKSAAFEGENIVNQTVDDVIKAEKFKASNTALDNIVSGTRYPFAGIRISPPGAGGDC